MPIERIYRIGRRELVARRGHLDPGARLVASRVARANRGRRRGPGSRASRNKRRGGKDVPGRRRPAQEPHRAGYVGQLHEHVAASRERVDALALLGVAADDYLGVRVEPEVPADLEELSAVLVELVVREEVLDPEAEAGVRKEAPAGGGGVFGYAELRGHGHLAGSHAAADVLEALAVHEPLFLGLGRRQEPRGERAKDFAPEPRLLVDEPERMRALGHRALAEYFACYEKVGADFGHVCRRAHEHRHVAVDAGVGGAAEAVGRIFEKRELRAREVEVDERDAEVPGRADGRRLHAGLGAAVEDGVEVDADHLDPLVQDEPRRQHGVEPAGHECNRFCHSPEPR